MAVLPIIKVGNPILRTVSRPVDRVTLGSKKFQQLISDMIATMHDANGVGIAAPQVNVDLQVAIINAKDQPFPIINPVVTQSSFRKSSAEEGCLSIPGVFGIVRRPQTVTVSYLDATGTPVTERVSGLLARVFQHEIDHLNGVLFIDRAQRMTEGTLP